MVTWQQFGNHTHYNFVLSNKYCLNLKPWTSPSNLPELSPLLIKELEAINAIIIVVVDVDWSDLLMGSLGQHMAIVSWKTLISLVTSLSIGHDKVKVGTCTIFIAVFQSSEGIEGAICYHQIDHGLSRKCKADFYPWIKACYLWLSKSWFSIDYLNPLTNPPVEDRVELLQIDDLTVGAHKWCDDNKALWFANSPD